MNIELFRQAFPEFRDPLLFSNEQLEYWNGLADGEISPDRFGAVRGNAVDLLTAHYMALARLNGIGTSPGVGGGLIASKSLGGASISYDNSGVSGAAGTQWSGTRYGVLLSQMMRRYGAGAVFL